MNVSNTLENVSVIGLGKLGFPLVQHFALNGFSIVGVDSNEELLVRLRTDSLLKGCSVRFGTSIGEAISQTDISFVIVPTPSLENGNFSLEPVKQVFRDIALRLKTKKSYHLIVLASTVTPGSFHGELLPLLETTSEKKCGLDFGYCYNPQFIALGSVLEDLRNPDFVLIGESDLDSGALLEKFYRRIFSDKFPVRRTSVINAEISKLAVNAFVTTKISFANFLGAVCAKIPTADVDEVTKTVGLDRRIGTAYLRAGAGFGGPCFPRDNQALLYTAESLKVDAPLPRATIAQNELIEKKLFRKIIESKKAPSDRIGILGLSYKLGTDVTEGSSGVALRDSLRHHGEQVNVWDEMHSEAGELRSFIENSEIIVITLPFANDHPALEAIRRTTSGPHMIIDCWRCL